MYLCSILKCIHGSPVTFDYLLTFWVDTQNVLKALNLNVVWLSLYISAFLLEELWISFQIGSMSVELWIWFSCTFLFPPILAALHLGCTPRRTSRSQRNNSAVCYLNSRDPEAPSSSPISLRDKIHGKPNVYSPLVPTDVRFMTPNTMNPAAFHSFETDTSRAQNHTSSDKRFPFLPENVPPCVNQRLPTSPNSHSVYPLYFGSEFHLADSRCDNKNLLGPHQLKDDAGCIWKNTLLHNLDACHAPSVNSLADCTHAHVNQTGTECDLSLRLGPVGVPCTSAVNTLLQERHNGNPGMSRDGSKLGYPPPHVDASFSYILNNGSVNDQLAPASRKVSSQPQDPNVEVMLKKQKVVSHLYEDRQFCYPLKLPFNHFIGKMRNAGP